MTSGTHIIGIDLGTTHCAVAFARAEAGAEVVDFPIPQLVQAGQLASLPTLPSALYLPSREEFPPAALALPWEAAPARVTGEFARWLGARVPGRLVLSSKSWLCHPGVDRSAAILPWGAGEGVTRLSPVDAARNLLTHLAGAWDHAHPDTPFRKQELIITVPASFDEVARRLTAEAASSLGVAQLSLVEEPQAAFYDFARRSGAALASRLAGARLILVVDVGGGTTDLTLIQAEAGAEGPELRRIAVGEHLMLGGDNMDVALARLVEERLAGPGRRLASAQWTQLVHVVRTAKEGLLSREAPEKHGLSIAGAGSRLLGSTLSCDLGREEARRCLLEGFLPACPVTERPRKALRAALQELGLPYAQDPAITRQVLGFLVQHAEAASQALGVSLEPGRVPRPDAILFNGGVFKSEAIAGALLSAMAAWWPGEGAPRVLENDSLDLAVARGAVARGLARRGFSRTIQGGAAHSYYVGLDTGSGADPRCVCVLPRGSAEGAVVELAERGFRLSLGRPVSFPLYASNDDKAEQAGRLLEPDPEFQELPPLHTVLPAGDGSGTREVHLQACLTELGTLELYCVSKDKQERWRLEFDLRRGLADSRPAEGATETIFLPPEVPAFLERFFGTRPPASAPAAKDFKQAFRQLEQWLGPREEWPLPLLRELWRRLDELAPQRRRSAEHERLYFQLAGYTLRPGFGHPLDDWRCAQSRRLFAELLRYPVEAGSWNEFWIYWRRIAGGLGEAGQQELWNQLMPHLARKVPHKPSKNLPRPKGVSFEGLGEMLRVAASLEQVEPSEKVLLGGWLAERLREQPREPGPWAWALGRLGARVPLHGSLHKVVPAQVAADWLELLLTLGPDQVEGGAFAVAQLARLSGDRERDIPEALRARTLAVLDKIGASPRLRRLVCEQVELDASEQARALGDSLPLGLSLG